jgi:hypothetical protein
MRATAGRHGTVGALARRHVSGPLARSSSFPCAAAPAASSVPPLSGAVSRQASDRFVLLLPPRLVRPPPFGGLTVPRQEGGWQLRAVVRRMSTESSAPPPSERQAAAAAAAGEGGRKVVSRRSPDGVQYQGEVRAATTRVPSPHVYLPHACTSLRCR